MDIIRTPKISNIKMLDKCQSLIHQSTDSTKTHNTISGTLYLTATHLIFIDLEAQQETWILHSQLSSITKHSVVSDGTPIQIKCKNFCTNTFIIPKEKDAHDLYTSLYQISQPLNLSDLYCFHYTASKEPFQFDRQFGWNKFKLVDEFKRQNVPNSNWSLTNLNQDYSLCDTYSKTLFVPSSATDKMLIASAKFRSKNRLPVLSYYYKKNSATISRCSQPLAGLSQRCVEDEQLLACILRSNENHQKPKLLYVVDTRPMINAMANRAAGKGYENSAFYDIKFHFFGIENIHVMRGSLQKLIEACEIKVPMSNNFVEAIASSGWLKHIKSVLETAFFVAKTVESGISVVVHCSDGWDRTAQTCSLAGLILDPYYRTLDGFQCLIEKEWLSFGHKFTDRCGHIQIGDSKEIAPVFTQFIDAVWQIMQQFPSEFEFNENYLFTIHDHVYSCQFGTFIGNCEREREKIDVRNNTYSLWAKLDSQREQYINPIYELSNEPKRSFLQVQLYSQHIRFWRSMYNRFDFGIHPRECLTELLTVTYNHTKSLEGHINWLKKQIEHVNRLKAADKSKINQFDSILTDSNEQLFTKKNSLGDVSIDSFDSINSPLKIVQECMQRLKMKNNLNDSNQLTSSSTTNLTENEESVDVDDNRVLQNRNNIQHEINLIELINSMQSVALDWQNKRSVRKCACGGSIDRSYDQTNFQTSNCWSCGLVYCCRCLEKRIRLPGHLFDDANIKYPHKDTVDRSNDNEQAINNEFNNKRNEQMNNSKQTSEPSANNYKIHPLEQINVSDQPLIVKPLRHSSVQSILELTNSIRTEKIEKSNNETSKNYKHHPLEQLEQLEQLDCNNDHIVENGNLNDRTQLSDCQIECEQRIEACNDAIVKDNGELINRKIPTDTNQNSLVTKLSTRDIDDHSTDHLSSNGNRDIMKTSIRYELVPVCLTCYRQMGKVN